MSGMTAENGHLEARVAKTEADTRSNREFMEDEFGFIREQLRDIKAALDIVLKTQALDERSDDDA